MLGRSASPNENGCEKMITQYPHRNATPHVSAGGPLLFPLGSRTNHGFTLVEILVSIAIFLTIAGSILAIFNGSLRTMRIASQNQEAYEVARGSLKTLERDLSLAFTSREHGDHYSFYGTPIGLTFVGLVKYHEDSEPNLARITYVIRAVDLDEMEAVPDKDGIVVEKQTYSLIRFVERNQHDLESFPVDWDTLAVADSGGLFLQDLIGDPNDPGGSNAASAVNMASVNGLCAAGDVECFNEVARAKKRELWIRMLAEVPPDIALQPTATFPALWETAPLNDAVALDYVLAENIRYVNAVDPLDVTPKILNVDTAKVADLRWSFFKYRDVNRFSDGNIKGANLAFWNDWRNINIGNNGLDDDLDGTPDQDGEGRVDLNSNGLNDDGDGATDEGDEFGEIFGGGIGSPISPHFPQQIVVDYTLFYEAPFPGATDFEETFTLEIDIPTAVRRMAAN